MPDGIKEDLTSRIKDMLDEAKEFAYGKGNHVFYGIEKGDKLDIPTTKSIIDVILKDAYVLSKNFDDIKKVVVTESRKIYNKYRENYKNFGKDGYLAKDRELQVLGHSMAGG